MLVTWPFLFFLCVCVLVGRFDHMKQKENHTLSVYLSRTLYSWWREAALVIEIGQGEAQEAWGFVWLCCALKALNDLCLFRPRALRSRCPGSAPHACTWGPNPFSYTRHPKQLCRGGGNVPHLCKAHVGFWKGATKQAGTDFITEKNL